VFQLPGTTKRKAIIKTGSDGVVRVATETNQEPKRWKVFLPKGTWRDEVVRQLHDGLTGGHLGRPKTIEKVTRDYFWPEMVKDLEQYVGSCTECLLRKSRRGEAGLLQPIRVSHVRQTLGIDLIGKLTKTNDGHQYILTAVDHLSK
jgi:hypothetical protein